MMHRYKYKERGFTIVELLIVVVVIAILAAITIVSYRGITQKANASVISNTVDDWEKAVRLAVVDGGTLPQGCLGTSSEFPATSDFASGECAVQVGVASVAYQGSTWSAWPTTTQKPKGIVPISVYHGNDYTLKGRGVWVLSNNPDSQSITLAWVTQQNGQCGRGIAISLDGDPVTSFEGYCGLVIQY